MTPLESPCEPLRFAALCCLQRPGPEWRADMHRHSAAADWALMLHIFRRHRIEGIAWDSLERSEVPVPAEFADELRSAAHRIAAGNLSTAQVMGRIDKALHASGVDTLHVKGLTLACLAYGTVATKSANDIDLLVDAEAVEDAASALTSLGYQAVLPHGGAELRQWHRRNKESVWRHPRRGFVIELHSALSNHPSLIPAIGLSSPRQQVVLPTGAVVATLAQPHLFAYLTVHGASSAWFRLKWIADLAAILSPLAPSRIDELYRSSRELGAGRSPALALLLCHWLFETPLSEPLLEEIGSDAAVRRLFRTAVGTFSGSSLSHEGGRGLARSIAIHRLQYGLVPGVRSKLEQLKLDWIALARRAAPPRAPA